NTVEPQPLGDELVQSIAGLRVVQHAPGRALDAVRGVELSFCGDFEKRGVGRRVPDKVSEARSSRVGLPLRIGRVFQPEYEVRRLEHGLDHRLRALEEILFGLENSLVAGGLGRFERTPESFEPESFDELCPAGRAGIGGAWDQTARVTTAKSIVGE